jgi:hypothetical protein
MRRARACAVRHAGSLFQRAAVFRICGDPRRPKCVIARFGCPVSAREFDEAAGLTAIIARVLPAIL